MNRRGWLAGVAVVACATGCAVYCTDSSVDEVIDLGVDVELLAVVQFDESAELGYLAVGEAGTAVVWGYTYPDKGEQSELILETDDLGDADLRGVWVAGDEVDTTSWWVVGDAGTIAVSDNRGVTWNFVDLGVTADLHAITGFAGRPVIVGDEVVLVRLADGTWSEPTPPAGGWGQLRGIGAHNQRIFAVGLAGVAVSASDPSGDWIAEPTGVGVDLLDVDGYGDDFGPATVVVAVGAAGTVLVQEANGWVPVASGVGVDLIDVDGGHALGADGVIYEVGTNGLNPLVSREGARALEYQVFDGFLTVGTRGSTAFPVFDCEYE